MYFRNGRKNIFLADERHPAANDDAPRTQEFDDRAKSLPRLLNGFIDQPTRAVSLVAQPQPRA